MPRRLWMIFSSLLLLALAAPAVDKPAAEKSASNEGRLVDEGTFAIFQMGRQVATEDFSIRQFTDHNVTDSHLRLDTGATDPQHAGKLEQNSELKLLPDGSLLRYEWKQLTPSVRSADIEPKDNVLIMHSVINGKPNDDHTFFLTPAAFVLDDYVFSVREVLLWRYLATSCKPNASGGCDLIRARFPIVIPLRGTSGEVFLEFKGYDDFPVNGQPEHLRHFVIDSDGPEWNLWLDNNQKVVRMSIPDASTEVLRQEKK